jgi:TolB protein
LNLSPDRFLGGTLLYEGGQSLVRYIAATYGDSALQKVIKYRKGRTYNFDVALHEATHHTLDEIYDEWKRTMIVYYATRYGTHEEIERIARKIPTNLAIVLSARLSPDGKRIAVLGKASEEDPVRLYVISNDTSATRATLSTEPGMQPYLAWSPDSKQILISKLRWGKNASLLYDLYRVDARSGSMDRVTTDERAEQADWSHTDRIVAVRSRESGSDLITMKPDGSELRQITEFNDPDVSVYWPRWSPDGSRIAFSIFRKNGKRDIAVIEPDTKAIVYVTNDSVNDRYPIWSPRGDSLLFVSFGSGIPNAYIVAATGGIPRQVTDIATNITAWDWPTGKDSALVTSFSYRNSVQLYWLPTQRTVHLETPPTMKPEYIAWRTVHWPNVTRTADSLPAVNITGPSSYNSLAHIRPLIYFPLIGTDLTRSGEEGTQWGAGIALRDDMGKHTLLGYGLYGDVSKAISYEVEYKNSQLVPDILVGAARTMGFDQVLADREYYERETAYHLDFHLSVPTADDLDASNEFVLGTEFRRMEPWNLQNFDTVTPEDRPIDARMVTLVAKYDFLSELTQAGISATHFDRKLGSTLTRTRLRGFFNFAIPLGDDEENQLAFVTRAAADLGDELPQDILGFGKYDEFEGGLNLVDLRAPDRIRGVRRYSYGNRLLYGAFEIRHHDPFFSNLSPLIKMFDPRLVEWIETGTTWYANRPTNNPNVTPISLGKTSWLRSAGVELRTQEILGFAIAGGVGWELTRKAQPDWYLRLTGDL